MSKKRTIRRRGLSAVLALSVCFGLLPPTAGAAVTAEGALLDHAARDADRAFRDAGNGHALDRDGREPGLRELVDIPAAHNAAVVARARQRLGHEIDDELARLADHIIGIARRTHRDRHHRRIGTDRTCPCNGENIRLSVFVRNRNHDRRKRVKHIARPPVYAAH